MWIRIGHRKGLHTSRVWCVEALFTTGLLDLHYMDCLNESEPPLVCCWGCCRQIGRSEFWDAFGRNLEERQCCIWLVVICGKNRNFVRGTCRLAAFDDRRVWTGTYGYSNQQETKKLTAARYDGKPVCFTSVVVYLTCLSTNGCIFFSMIHWTMFCLNLKVR